LTKYLNGDGIDNKLRVQTGGDVKYFLADHLGSTNALTDSSGNITSSASYDSFGNATGNLNTRYQFTGREFDNFTGLHYYRARWYDANLGRFISEDPIGLAGGINTYGYVENNPLSFRDPSGKIPVLIPIIIGATALILTSPSYANAPGPGDPVYDSRSPLIANAVMGFVGGYALRVVGGAIFGAIGSKFCKTGSGSVAGKFVPDDLAYGPSAGGKLAEWAESNGVKTLNNLPKPTELTIEQFSAQTIEKTAFLGNKIHFDLTNVKDISGVLKGTGEFGKTVTAFELQYIKANWSHLSNTVIFYKNGVVTGVPW
jgi:RHS repeat-associated protein